MAVIYFLRHGQTDWNAARRIQGHIDTPLNDLGRSQAARNGRELAGVLSDPVAFDYLSSPLSRATETMEIVRRELGLDAKGYRTDARLMEYCLGDWEGMLYDDITAQFPEIVAEQRRDQWNFRYPGERGESFAALSARVFGCLGEITRSTVITAHGGVMRCIRRHFDGLSAEETFKLDVPQDKVLRIDNNVLSWL
jgi:broad specificity phosphatase PhoE